MNFHKDIGIVLQNRRWSESSHILTTFTLENGKMTFLSRGSRRPKSFVSSCHKTGSIIECIWQHQNKSDLHLLSSVNFFNTPLNFHSFVQIWSLLQILFLVKTTIPNGQKHPNGFMQLSRTIYTLAEYPSHSNKLYLQFFIRWLGEIGYGLTLEKCCQCGCRITGKEIVGNYSDGNFYCELCNNGKNQDSTFIILRGDSIATMKLLETTSEKLVHSIRLSTICFNEIDTFLRLYLKFHTGNFLKLHLFNFYH